MAKVKEKAVSGKLTQRETAAVETLRDSSGEIIARKSENFNDDGRALEQMREELNGYAEYIMRKIAPEVEAGNPIALELQKVFAQDVAIRRAFDAMSTYTKAKAQGVELNADQQGAITESGLELMAAAKEEKDGERRALYAEMLEDWQLDFMRGLEGKTGENSYTDASKHMRELMKNPACTVKLSDDQHEEATIVFDSELPISPMEYNVLRSIVAFQEAGQTTASGAIYFTAQQLYRKIRGDAGRTSLSGDGRARQEIEKTLDGLDRRITMMFSKGAFTWIKLDGQAVKFEGTKARPKILEYTPIEGRIEGNAATLYIVHNLPIISAITKQLGHGETIPQRLLAIKKKNGDKWGRFTLNEARIAIRTSLEMFVWQAIRARQAERPRRVSLKKPYADILTESRITDKNKSRTLQKVKETTAVILEYWKHEGVIADWGVYSTKTDKERGIYITLDEGGALE